MYYFAKNKRNSRAFYADTPWLEGAADKYQAFARFQRFSVNNIALAQHV